MSENRRGDFLTHTVERKTMDEKARNAFAVRSLRRWQKLDK